MIFLHEKILQLRLQMNLGSNGIRPSLFASILIKREDLFASFLLCYQLLANLQYDMFNILRSFTAHIYDIFISFFFTLSAHLLLIDHMNLSGGNFLDVGCGTGKPLHAIVHRLKQIHQKIVGVDLHPSYTQKAIKLFEGDKQVEIYNMDFYKITDNLQIKFRTVFFSFSFMLMPDHLKALEVAKNILEKSSQSRICFTLTINKNRNSLLNKIKPFIKRITTVDFGNVVYEDSFLSVLDSADLQVLKFIKLRSTFNLFLWLAPVYYVESRPKQKII